MNVVQRMHYTEAIQYTGLNDVEVRKFIDVRGGQGVFNYADLCIELRPDSKHTDGQEVKSSQFVVYTPGKGFDVYSKERFEYLYQEIG